MAVKTNAAACDTWVTLDEAARRLGYNSGRSLVHYLRRWERAHPQHSLRRVPGRIHWADLLHCYDISAKELKAKRQARGQQRASGRKGKQPGA